MFDVDALGRHEAELLREEAARIADTETALQSVLDGDVLVPLVTHRDAPPRMAGTRHPVSVRRRMALLVGVAAAVAVVAVLAFRPSNDPEIITRGEHGGHLIDRAGGATPRPADRVRAGVVPVVGRISGGHPRRLRPGSEDAHLVRRRAARGARHSRRRCRAGPTGGRRAARRRLPAGGITWHGRVGTRGDRPVG